MTNEFTKQFRKYIGEITKEQFTILLDVYKKELTNRASVEIQNTVQEECEEMFDAFTADLPALLETFFKTSSGREIMATAVKDVTGLEGVNLEEEVRSRLNYVDSMADSCDRCRLGRYWPLEEDVQLRDEIADAITKIATAHQRSCRAIFLRLRDKLFAPAKS